jgi:riboflavin kinase/FMN adenylyltransferase
MELVNTTELIVKNNIGITIGSFDGLHLGHDHLLKNFVNLCQSKDLSPVVLSFSPHPRVHLKKCSDFLIQNTNTKKLFIENKYNVLFVEVKFDEKLQKLDGENFFQELKEKFPKIKMLFTGHDFGLGINKSINYNKAKALLTDVEVIQDVAFKVNDIKISSSLIRKKLKEGMISEVNQYLNRPFSLIGKVVKGNQIGRDIGFPTANVEVDDLYIKPKNGIYACEILINDTKFLGIANIGTRPTVTEDKNSTLEVHILDFNTDIYMKEVEVLFYKHIRDEVRFDSREDLIIQIKKDIKVVRKDGLFRPFALVGKNISHSKSDETYKNLLETQNISYSFLDFPSTDKIANIKELLKEHSYISITAPYKKFFFDNVDLVLPEIQNLGSINCIKLVGEKSIGTNTDYFAIKDILSNLLEAITSEVLILGDGAMSELIQTVLKSFSINFKVLSRKNSQLLNLSDLISENSLIINACARSFIPVFKTIYKCTFWDLNYNQQYSKTIQENKLIKYIDGYGMLTLQAKYALSFWNLKTF